MVCINNIYDREWTPNWTNPFETYQRVYEHSDCVEVHFGRHQIRISKDKLVNFDKTKYSSYFISKEKFGNLLADKEGLINYNEIKQITITEDDSDDGCFVYLLKENGEELYFSFSYHNFWDSADIFFLKLLKPVIPTKTYWTDGGRTLFLGWK